MTGGSSPASEPPGSIAGRSARCGRRKAGMSSTTLPPPRPRRRDIGRACVAGPDGAVLAGVERVADDGRAGPAPRRRGRARPGPGRGIGRPARDRRAAALSPVRQACRRESDPGRADCPRAARQAPDRYDRFADDRDRARRRVWQPAPLQHGVRGGLQAPADGDPAPAAAWTARRGPRHSFAHSAVASEGSHVSPGSRFHVRRRVALERDQRGAVPALYRPGAVPARAGADLQGAELELSVPGRRDPQCRRLDRDDDRRGSGHRRAGGGRQDQRFRQSLRPSRQSALPRTQGHGQGDHLHLSRLEL